MIIIQKILISKKKYSAEIRRIRLTEANKTGNVIAGLAPNLPIKDSSVDYVVDSWAAGYYLDKNSNNFINYIHDISRVLKPGGKAKLYPVFDKEGFRLDTKRFQNLFPDIKIEFVFGSVFIGLSIFKLFDKDFSSRNT